MDKSPDAFRTISEVADCLDTPAHVLRFWESRFTQVKPVKRAGGRRYYRPADIALLGGIKKLLHEDGLTIRGVQKILREEGVRYVASLAPAFEEIAAEVAEDLKTVVDEIEPSDAPDTKADILPFPEAGTPASAPSSPPLPSSQVPSSPVPAQQDVKAPPAASQPDLFQAAEAEVAPVAREDQSRGEADLPPLAEGDGSTDAAQIASNEDAPFEAQLVEVEPARAKPASGQAPAATVAVTVADDPADNDPAFAGPVPAFQIRNPAAVAVRLRASPAEASAALSRLRALRDRMAIYAR